MQLYDWQTECLDQWAKNQYKGIVNAVTGTGKTVLALGAIQKLESTLGGQGLKIKIIVPKVFLVRQWYYALRDILGVSRQDIGKYLGTHKSQVDCKYMIYVINSARYSFARHMLDETQCPVLIIADECHHYGTEENAKVFDFARVAPQYRYYALGLSATPYCRNYHEILERYVGCEIYRFSFVQALKAGIISRFSIVNIGVDFDGDEMADYEELTDKLILAMRQLRKLYPQLNYTDKRRLFIVLDSIVKTHINPDVRQLAQSIRFLSFQRKELVYLAKSRIQCVEDLLSHINKHAKIIIFGERIEMANALYRRLCTLFPGQVGVYHSELNENVRKAILRSFEDSEIRILVSCRTLDEGLDISDADVGVVMSSTSGERQRIQRLGRILRRKSERKHAYLYYLYVNGTMEETEIFHGMADETEDAVNSVSLYYDKKARLFSNALYDELSGTVLAGLKDPPWGAAEIAELKRNVELGIVSCDWLSSEEECISRIRAAASKGERNYNIAMLFMSRARRLLQ